MTAIWTALKDFAAELRRLTKNIAGVNDEIEARLEVLPPAPGTQPKQVKAVKG